jgi:sphinganine-1-phosphate aldolase
LTVPLVDTFIADLRDSIEEAKTAPGGKGNMVQVYGMWFTNCVSSTRVRWFVECTSVPRGMFIHDAAFLLSNTPSGYMCLTYFPAGLGNSSVVGPTMVGKLATVFLDTMYKA